MTGFNCLLLLLFASSGTVLGGYNYVVVAALLRCAMKPAMNVGPAWLNLAVALEHQSRFGEALACARESERLMPQDPRARATAERIIRAMR